MQRFEPCSVQSRIIRYFQLARGGCTMDEITQTGTPEFEALPERRGAQWIFIGEHGLRAGWSALIFVAIFIVLELLYGVTVGPFFRAHMDMNAPLGRGIAILQECIH